LGKLLQDIYTGIERILRCKLQARNLKIIKAESWHKEILLAARKNNLVAEEYFGCFRELLLFRHMQIHGYGYMLDKQRLLAIAKPVPAACKDFLEKAV